MADGVVYIHAGAHRTGTSSFQLCLHLNSPALASAGLSCAFPGRDFGAGALGLRLPKPRHADRAPDTFAENIKKELARHINDPAHDLILSEENLPGRMIHFQAGRFYPAAEARFAALRAGLGDRVVGRLVLVVRRYDALFQSAYRKRAEDQPSEPFAKVREAMAGIDRGWPELVALIRDILRPESLLVVPYGQRGTSVALLHRLVPELERSTLQEPERSLNQSATDAALINLQARYRAGETLKSEEWQAVIAQYADERESRGFTEFTRSQEKHLRQMYRRDLIRLSQMPGITFDG